VRRFSKEKSDGVLIEVEVSSESDCDWRLVMKILAHVCELRPGRYRSE